MVDQPSYLHIDNDTIQEENIEQQDGNQDRETQLLSSNGQIQE